VLAVLQRALKEARAEADVRAAHCVLGSVGAAVHHALQATFDASTAIARTRV
jgi:hypothetical protein